MKPIETYLQADRQAGRQTDRHTDRQAEKQEDKLLDGHTIVQLNNERMVHFGQNVSFHFRPHTIAN